jgi:hypothetical protein
MTTPLSPTAQAVLDAYITGLATKRRDAIAAALRAVTDRVEDLIGDIEDPKFVEGVLTASHFLDLVAAELEGQP